MVRIVARSLTQGETRRTLSERNSFRSIEHGRPRTPVRKLHCQWKRFGEESEKYSRRAAETQSFDRGRYLRNHLFKRRNCFAQKQSPTWIAANVHQTHMQYSYQDSGDEIQTSAETYNLKLPRLISATLRLCVRLLFYQGLGSKLLKT